eukprot:gene411-488_t
MNNRIYVLGFVASMLCVHLLAECELDVCVKEGEVCSGKNIDFDCDMGMYCSSTSSSSINGTCIKYRAEGDSCADDKKCFPNLECYGQRSAPTCRSTKFAAANEECDSAVDCASKNMVCLNERCALATGRTCTADSECPFQQYCDSIGSNGSGGEGMCLDRVPVGTSCLSTGEYPRPIDICQNGLVCSPDGSIQPATPTPTQTDIPTPTQPETPTPTLSNVKYICQAVFSKTEGQPCSGDPSLSLDGQLPRFECSLSAGLRCDNNVCVKMVVPTIATCNKDSDCPSGYECICDTSSSSVGTCQSSRTQWNTESCQKSIESLFQCATKHKCKVTPGSSSSESCLYDECGDIICKSSCVQGGQIDQDKATCSRSKPYYGCMSNSTTYIKPQIAIALLAICILLLLFI